MVEPGENKEEQQEVVVVPTAIDEIDQIIATNRGLLSEERIKELEGIKAEKIKAGKAFIKENGGVTQEEIDAAEKAAAEKKVPKDNGSDNEESEEEEQEEEGNEEENEEEKEPGEEKGDKKTNVLGIELNPNKKDKKPIEVKSIDDVYGLIKKQYGQSVKDPQTLAKFLSDNASKWRTDSTKLPEIEKEAKQWKSVVENLPGPLLDAVKAHYSGQDYNKILSERPPFDFAQPAEKQDSKKLISHYFPGKFTPEQIEKMGTDEEDPAITLAKEVSVDKFNAEKKSREDQIAAYENRVKESRKAYITSVEGSVGFLKKSFPAVDRAAEASVKERLSGGAQKILELFINQDGTVKEGAAEMILLAEKGKEVISEMMEAAARAAETRVNEEIVNRGSKEKRKQGGGGGTGSDISPEAKKVLEGLNKLRKPVQY